MTDDSLKGWKEISTFLGASERTAQRWESELSLPVHRLSTRPGAGVFALREELVAWRSSKAGQVAARQEAERSERDKAAAVSSPGPGSPLTADTAAASGPLLHALPAARRPRQAMFLLLAAGLVAAGFFAAWSAWHRTPEPFPQPTAATTNPVRLRIVWTNGAVMWAVIPEGGKARITVGTQLLEFSATRMDSMVKVGVAVVRPGGTPGEGDTVSFLGQFVLRPGVTATVQQPSPFSVEWIAPDRNKAAPAAR